MTEGPIAPGVSIRISTRVGTPVVVTGCLNSIALPKLEVAVGSPNVTGSAATAIPAPATRPHVASTTASPRRRRLSGPTRAPPSG